MLEGIGLKLYNAWMILILAIKKNNKNLGKIIYTNVSIRNTLKSSILNIVTVLTKICSSRLNNIEETYCKLFDREFKADSVSDLVEEFLNLLTNKSVGLKCKGEGIAVSKIFIYGTLMMTITTKNMKGIKIQLKYLFVPQNIKIAFINKENLSIEEQRTIQFKSNIFKKNNPLEHIVFNCARKLQN